MNPVEIDNRSNNVYMYALLVGLTHTRATYYKNKYITRMSGGSYSDHIKNLGDILG